MNVDLYLYEQNDTFNRKEEKSKRPHDHPRQLTRQVNAEVNKFKRRTMAVADADRWKALPSPNILITLEA